VDAPSANPGKLKEILIRYGAAAAAVAAALVLKLLLDQTVETGAPFLLFPLAILVAAWFGGIGPGLFATALAAALAAAFLVPDTQVNAAVVVRGIVFILQGIGISLIALALQRAKHGAEQDAARARSTAEELRRRDDQILLITNSLPVLISYIDSSHRYRFVNQAYEDWFGLPRNEIIGRHAREILGAAAYESLRPFFDQAVGGELVTYEREVHYSRAGTREINATYVPHVGDGGRVEGFVVLVVDVSKRKQAEEAVQAAKAEAETANRMKDQFLATLSHELRTPLNAIFGWAQLLRSGKLDPATVERGVETIERNARAQKQLIDDLLDVSRIISGKLRLEMQPLEPADVVEAALETVAHTAQAKGLNLRRHIDRTGLVVGDAQRLQQVVWNLLSNAVKFTPKGGEVRVAVETLDGHAKIIVADSGQGIAPEFLPHVFERFRQADPSSTRRHGGLGLGLAIVRQLVELHGGSVRAESPGEGQGATFIVSLPLAVSDQSEERRQTQTGDGGRPVSLDGLRVLVVDDEADARDLLREILSGSHAEVAVAASAAEGLDVLERFQPHVLVSDISMPGQDGYELIRTVRKRGYQLPAAALTAFARADDRRRALLAGFQIHLAKPVDPGELTAAVASLAGRAGETDPDPRTG
jgi:PAS domain S-box-containing protein